MRTLRKLLVLSRIFTPSVHGFLVLFQSPYRNRTNGKAILQRTATTAAPLNARDASPEDEDNLLKLVKNSLQNLDLKVESVRKHGVSIIGKTITKIEFLEYRFGDEDSWTECETPILIHCGSSLLRIKWADFDKLWLSNDEELDDDDERYVASHDFDDAVVGRKIRGIWLGGGELLSFGEKSIDGWTRLFLDLGDDVWFEVYNKLDDNEYEIHTSKPVDCKLKFCI